MLTSSPDQPSFGFVEEAAAEKSAAAKKLADENQRALWLSCWGWEGPQVGSPCEIGTCITELETPTESEHGDKIDRIYGYTERCILISLRPDGRWLAEIRVGEIQGKPWPKDGTRVVLDILDISPPVRELIAARAAEEKELKPAPRGAFGANGGSAQL